MAPNRYESRWIFGLHDPGGEQTMLDAGKPGWIVFTEAIGADPKSRAGRDFRPYGSRGFGVICRLNHGYYPDGTLPFSGAYAAFAQRCANFVSASPGCHHWIIGNEPNYSIERPTAQQRELPALVAEQEPLAAPEPPKRWWERLLAWLARLMRGAPLRQAEFAPMPWEPSPVVESVPLDDPFLRSLPERFSALDVTPASAAQAGPAAQSAALYGEVITPALYARCYRLCRDAIRGLPGHEEDRVLVAGIAPWNNQTRYRGNERGDWATYLGDVLEQLGPEGCDGLAMHAYTHGSSPRLIASDAKMQPPFADRHYEFRVYRDFLGAVPTTMRHLPVYMTETDQVEPWLNDNTGWVQKVYAEVNDWNRLPGNQIIHALALYRWPRYDRWYIDGKQGVIADFRAALARDYRWDYQTPLPAGFRAGDLLKLVAYVNLRRTPGYIGKTADDRVGDLQPGQTVSVLDASSTVVDGLVWWRVQVQDVQPALQGWLAQAGPDGMPLVERVSGEEPTVPTAPPPVVARLKLGDRVRTTTIVNARRTPGHMNKPADDVVREVTMGTVLTLVDGPQIVDSLVWWIGEDDLRVRAGWLAESLPTGAALLEVDTGTVVTPPVPSEPVARFKPGDRVMTVAFVRLRRTPGFLNKPPEDVIAEIWQGTSVVIVSGPESVDDLAWWEVDTQDITGRDVRGWMAEAAPGGMPLLGERKNEDTTPFKRGDLAVVGPTPVLIRRTAGYINKPDDDVLGEFAARTTLYLLQGPRNSDGLAWWRVSGVTRFGATSGWVAQGAANGATLVGRGVKLPGTSIPDLKAGAYLGAPFAGQFGISQLWGERPEFYARYSYDGVALLGHNGIDFLTPMGTVVTATDSGEVVMTGFEPDGFGNYVMLAHAWGQSVYAHLETIGVGLGQRLDRGATVGASGNSGGSTGPHLHFAIRIHPFVRTDGWGGYADPLPYMNPGDVQWPSYMLDATSQALPGGPVGETPRMPPPRMADDAPGLIRP